MATAQPIPPNAKFEDLGGQKKGRLMVGWYAGENKTGVVGRRLTYRELCAIDGAGFMGLT